MTTKEDIITLPNPHLRQKSVRVHVITPEVAGLVKSMTEAAIDWEASRPHEISAALAAVQIDRLERVVIIRSDFENKDNNEFTVLINPEIVKTEGSLHSDYEGCLSVPSYSYPTGRADWARVTGVDEFGDPVSIEGYGLFARCLQHEVGHLDGFLYTDMLVGRNKRAAKKDFKAEGWNIPAEPGTRTWTPGEVADPFGHDDVNLEDTDE